MKAEIRNIPEKKFIGMAMRMSFAENKTVALWRGFMPRRAEIPHTISSELYSGEIYPANYFNPFNPVTEFEKWALVEVASPASVPPGMETLTSPAGTYAVFIRRGPASDGPKTYQHIFGVWLPQSDYLLDERPHFAVMGEKYKHDAADSEEELWIPIKPRAR
ncbi:MAG: GyrI-like domain-containing protein [Turneriella sp.]